MYELEAFIADLDQILKSRSGPCRKKPKGSHPHPAHHASAFASKGFWRAPQGRNGGTVAADAFAESLDFKRSAHLGQFTLRLVIGEAFQTLLEDYRPGYQWTLCL